MIYEGFASYIDTIKQAKSFVIVINMKNGKQISSSSIPISEYSATDSVVSETMIIRGVVSIWNAASKEVYNIPADNIDLISYRFI